MIEFYRFFANQGQELLVSNRLNAFPSSAFPTNPNNFALILGPPRRYPISSIIDRLSGRTSLLFQYAYSYASQGRMVVFICSKRKIQNNLPLFLEEPSSDTLKHIHMK